MAKLFWLLLAAAKGGYRYLRAILEAGTVSLKAKATTAPGSPMEAKLNAELSELMANPVSRPVSDMEFKAEVEPVKLSACMVAWLVSDAVFRGAVATVSLIARIIAASAAVMRGNFQQDVELTADIEAAPGSPTQFCGQSAVDLKAEPIMSPPVPMEADLVVEPPDLEATVTAGLPDPLTTDLETAPVELSVNMSPGTPAATQAKTEAGTVNLTARMHTWREPVATGTTLYIHQVYAVEENGTTLKLK